MKVVDPNNPPPGVAPPTRTAQVLRFHGVTRLDIDPEQVIEGARAAGLGAVVVLGYTEAGEEFFSSSLADGADALWLLERLKIRLLTGGAQE